VRKVKTAILIGIVRSLTAQELPAPAEPPPAIEVKRERLLTRQPSRKIIGRVWMSR
jgi:hypothetical protein